MKSDALKIVAELLQSSAKCADAGIKPKYIEFENSISLVARPAQCPKIVAEILQSRAKSADAGIQPKYIEFENMARSAVILQVGETKVKLSIWACCFPRQSFGLVRLR